MLDRLPGANISKLMKRLEGISVRTNKLGSNFPKAATLASTLLETSAGVCIPLINVDMAVSWLLYGAMCMFPLPPFPKPFRQFMLRDPL